MKQSAWYCFRIASTVGSCGPTALWQKAQMSVGREQGRSCLGGPLRIPNQHSQVHVLTSGAVPLPMPICILPLQLVCLSLANLERPQFSREGKRSLASRRKTRIIFKPLRMGKLRHAHGPDLCRGGCRKVQLLQSWSQCLRGEGLGLFGEDESQWG